MTKNEILSSILSIEGAALVRTNASNYVAIPTENGYVKVALTDALTKDTKNHKAFNFEAGVAEYKAWEAQTALKAAEKANRPVKVKGPNPEAQARRDALDAKIAEMPSFTNYTATDIMRNLDGLAENVTVMAIGSSAKRLVEKGVLTMKVMDKKSYYTKA